MIAPHTLLAGLLILTLGMAVAAIGVAAWRCAGAAMRWAWRVAGKVATP